MEKLGFVWDVDEHSWNQHFIALENYKAEFGHVNVIAIYKTTNELNLGGWCQHQRNNYKNNKLSENQIKRLESLGFVWVLKK